MVSKTNAAAGLTVAFAVSMLGVLFLYEPDVAAQLQDK